MTFLLCPNDVTKRVLLARRNAGGALWIPLALSPAFPSQFNPQVYDEADEDAWRSFNVDGGLAIPLHRDDEPTAPIPWKAV